MHKEIEKKKLNPLGAVNKKELYHKAMLEVNEDTAEEARRIAIEVNPPYFMETYRGNLIQFTYNPDTDKYEPLFIPKSLNDADRCLELSYMLEGKFTLLFGYHPEKLNGEKVNGNYSRWDEQKSKSWDDIWNDIFEYDTEMMLREMENESLAIFRNETKTSDWDDLNEQLYNKMYADEK